MNALTGVRDLYSDKDLTPPPRESARPPREERDAVVIDISSGAELVKLLQAPKTPGLALHHVRFRRTVTAQLPPSANLYRLQLTLCGGSQTRSEGPTLSMTSGDVTVVNPDCWERREWQDGSEHLFVSIGSSDIERAVGDAIGDHGRRKVSFSNQITPAERSPTLLNYLYLLREDLNCSGVFSNPTMAKLSLEMISSLMVRLLPNDKQRHIQTSRSPAAPYYVRRAIDYAEERFGEAISLRDMAAASGVCSRTLDKGFRRFCDKSPMEHLRAVRLENARLQLMRRHEAQTTVSTTARLCGFRHLGRFAEYYARQFGELPSQTLVRQQSLD